MHKKKGQTKEKQGLGSQAEASITTARVSSLFLSKAGDKRADSRGEGGWGLSTRGSSVGDTYDGMFLSSQEGACRLDKDIQ